MWFFLLEFNDDFCSYLILSILSIDRIYLLFIYIYLEKTAPFLYQLGELFKFIQKKIHFHSKFIQIHSNFPLWFSSAFKRFQFLSCYFISLMPVWSFPGVKVVFFFSSLSSRCSSSPIHIPHDEELSSFCSSYLTSFPSGNCSFLKQLSYKSVMKCLSVKNWNKLN